MVAQTTSSLVAGPQTPELLDVSLGQLIDQQAKKYGDKTAIVNSWQQSRQSFSQLAERSKIFAKAMLEAGLKKGDSVGIFAGNRFEYIELFFGAARIGCPFVVLNSTYTPSELARAVSVSDCKLIFLAARIGTIDCSSHIELACGSNDQEHGFDGVKRVILLDPYKVKAVNRESMSYSTFFSNAHSVFMNDSTLRRAEKIVKSDDVLNLQFTSGTTGIPKAAVLTHHNLINNGMLVGDCLKLRAEDILCCPPPLYHCFGLVMGLLASIVHGSTIVFPSDVFNPGETLDALAQEGCTILYGVPTMFVAQLEANKTKKYKFSTITTALAAGSPVPRPLMKQLESGFGVQITLIAYGMTETSPVTFMTVSEDSLDKRVATVGRAVAHSGGKVISADGKVLGRGERGELCTSGYSLQKGYYKNPQKTNEVMIRDEAGTMWMHTGDECWIDEEGYCYVTGRMKDMIIRGGENIIPTEIENRLLAHAAISEASVVGLPDEVYGEAVSAFLKHADSTTPRPSDAEVVEWVRQDLSRHKAPRNIFWIGDSGVGDDFPKTGSGKHQKHILRDLGSRLLKKDGKPKL